VVEEAKKKALEAIKYSYTPAHAKILDELIEAVREEEREQLAAGGNENG